MSKSNSENRILLNRREALLMSATAGLGLAMSKQASASDSIKTGVHQQEPGNCSTPRTAVANTQYGKVRGFVMEACLPSRAFRTGKTRAAKTAGCRRKPPVPWKDEYPALIYGANCPQNLHDWTGIEQTFLQDWDDGWQSEDMLKLNIWTPSLTGKRPVMFYIHGGGFCFGSSYELPSHEGAQMARHHDVVQVSVNHRLNALGFLDVSEVGGSAYEDSVNVGMTDLVAALKWVQENISNFGGDPDKVMIYGQSGGGVEGDDAAGHAVGGGTDPSRVGAIGRRRQHPDQRAAEGVCAADGEGARHRRQRHRRAAEDGVGEADQGGKRRGGQDVSSRFTAWRSAVSGPPRAGLGPECGWTRDQR